MQDLHPDSAAIDRIGTRAIIEHFKIKRQSVFYWRRTGVPRTCLNPVVLLGKQMGHDMTDLEERAARVS
jgi:hypothetical protein